MIHPAPTAAIDPRHARGTLVGVAPETATRPAFLRVSYPNSRYELHLRHDAPLPAEPGHRLIGTIHARAKRIDVVGSGGRYVEPVSGRPRRVQGSIIAIETGTGEIVVHAGVPIHCKPTDPRQRVSDFEVGQFVSFDVMEGASFKPVASR